MTISQQIALGILTSVLGAAVWEFLNYVYPDIKSFLGRTVAACRRTIAKIRFSFKKTASLIGDKLNIDFFENVVREAATFVFGAIIGVGSVIIRGAIIVAVLYQFGKMADVLFAKPNREDATVISIPGSSTCDCPLPTRSVYSNTSEVEWLQSLRSRRSSPQPSNIIYSAPALSDSIISEETSGDCPPVRKGRKSNQSRRSSTIKSTLNNSYTFSEPSI